MIPWSPSSSPSRVLDSPGRRDCGRKRTSSNRRTPAARSSAASSSGSSRSYPIVHSVGISPMTVVLQSFAQGGASVIRPLRRLAPILLLAVALSTTPAHAQSEGTLRDRIGSGKAQERSLASAAARLGALERETSREVGILEGRLANAQSDLNAAQTRLATTQAALDAARK